MSKDVPKSDECIKVSSEMPKLYELYKTVIDDCYIILKEALSEDAIKSIEEQYPNKRYFEIFLFRYVRKYNQADTAREMKISQVELSKRLNHCMESWNRKEYSQTRVIFLQSVL